MRNPIQTGRRDVTDTGTSAYETRWDALSELGRATTAYHEAPPEEMENARQEYEEALRNFKAIGFFSAAPE